MGNLAASTAGQQHAGNSLIVVVAFGSPPQFAGKKKHMSVLLLLGATYVVERRV